MPSVRCQLKPVVSVAVSLTQVLKRLSEPLRNLSWRSPAKPSAQPAWRVLPVSSTLCPFLDPVLISGPKLNQARLPGDLHAALKLSSFTSLKTS